MFRHTITRLIVALLLALAVAGSARAANLATPGHRYGKYYGPVDNLIGWGIVTLDVTWWKANVKSTAVECPLQVTYPDGTKYGLVPWGTCWDE